MPFEDFEVGAHVVARAGRPPVFERALTAGPGDYDVVVAWSVVDDRDRPLRSGARRHAISLPPVQTEGLCSAASSWPTPSAPAPTCSADQQTAHPYAIGGTEIDPAPDAAFTNDERLSVAFQVFNAAPSMTGKPDITVALRLYRQTPGGEDLAASLAPLESPEGTLPADFDLLQGTPAGGLRRAAPDLPRGEYRLAIAVTEIASPGRRPPPRHAFASSPRPRPCWPALRRSPRPSFAPACSRPRSSTRSSTRWRHRQRQRVWLPCSLARQHRFVDLMVDTPVAPPDRGTATLLQAMAAYALGDTPRAITVRLARALDAGAPAGATQFWIGAVHALEGRDADAVTAWTAARAAGWPNALVAPLVAEAQVRAGRLPEAGRTAREAIEAGALDPSLARVAAAADLTARRYAAAADRLTTHLAFAPDDAEAQWMLVHALFGAVVGTDTGAALSPDEARSRLRQAVERYQQSGGRHRALADEWLDFATSSASAPVP